METLLNEMKNALDLMWQDEEADKKLKAQITRGIRFISDKTGVSDNSFASDSEHYNPRAQELLVNYLLYDRAGSLDEFKRNYQKDIVGLQIKFAVDGARNEDSNLP